MDAISNWMHVDYFTVDQAAALWCNIDPNSIPYFEKDQPSEFAAAKQMLLSAIVGGEISVDTSSNPMQIVGNHSKSLVKRKELESFARSRQMFPEFLFDTIAPFGNRNSGGLTFTLLRPPVVEMEYESTIKPVPNSKPNKGGRPQEHDWDSFTLEIIKRANQPNGLPDTQAELVRDMLTWFNERFGSEPAESSLKARISKIYKYLEKAENPSA